MMNPQLPLVLIFNLMDYEFGKINQNQLHCFSELHLGGGKDALF